MILQVRIYVKLDSKANTVFLSQIYQTGLDHYYQKTRPQMLQLIQHGRFLAAKMVGFSIMSRSSVKLYSRYLLGEEPSHLSILCLGVQVCDCLGKQLTIMDGRAWYDHSTTMILIGYQIFSSSTFLAVDICSLISFHLNIDSHFHFPVLKILPLSFSQS